MKKIKILFQGDSITDAWRDRDDYHDLGRGYPKYAANYLRQKYPEIDFEFVDLGISGNKIEDLVDRLQNDFIDIQPDIVSILIGVNDTWHRSDDRKWLANDVFEARYRKVLDAMKGIGAKIMMIEPFLGPVEDKLFFREDLDFKIDTVRKLALEYADAYLPTDGLLHSAFIGDDHLTYMNDGVHPTPKGADFIGCKYVEYISPIIDKLIAE